MLINNNSRFITFNPQKLNPNETQKLYIPKGLEEIVNSIVKNDGKYYYYKEVDFNQLINELVGSYFSRLIHLDAVDYQIGICNGKLYALSQIFYSPDYEYHNCQDFFGTIANHKLAESESLIPRIYLVEDKLLKMINNSTMLLNILKLTFLDIKMGQIDRNNLENIIVKKSKSNGLVDLAPMFDFECSYDDSPPYPEFYFYDNPFVVLRKNRLSISSLCKRYPQILETLHILATLKIGDVLDQIQEEKRIVLSKEESEYYEEKDKEYSRVLQKIIKS